MTQSTTTQIHLHSRFTLHAIAWVLLVGWAIFAQNPQSAQPQIAPTKLSLRAEIVLSPEFCATRRRQSPALKDVLNVGKATCAQLYAALVPVFSDLTKLESVPTAGNGAAHITLIPRFVDISATQHPFRPSSQ